MIPPEKVKELPRYAQAVPTRFVLTDKHEALRTRENPLPAKVKARLVVLGNLEKDANIRRDAQQAVCWPRTS